jgi:hypothetical protein
MKHFAFVLILLCLGAAVPTVIGDDNKKPKVPREKLDPEKVRVLMHKKLDGAQKILAALTLNDLDRTGASAADLLQVSKEAEFLVFKTRDYEMYRDEFRRSAEALVRQAKEKNLEAAKLSYLEMTMSCFHCHAYVRDVGMVRFDTTGGGSY